MPITSVTSDPTRLTLTAIGDFPVPVNRLWQAWTDPRQLEQFWGPSAWPATFTRHEVRVGGRSEYAMTGPNGEVSRGFWTFLSVEPADHFEVRDGFLTDDGRENTELPGTHMRITFESTPTGSRFVAVSTFGSLEAMETLVAMGMVEGLRCALSQLDDLLADLRDAAGELTTLELLDDTHVEVTRTVRSSMRQVWRAHQEPELIRRWMLGPEGWTMPVCEVAEKVGDTYRYEWASGDGQGRFGFVGEVLEREAPRRSVFTENLIGHDGPGTVNELLLTPRPGDRTHIRVRVTYPSLELRDIVLASGMVDGMEASYARLESLIYSGARLGR